MLTNRQKEILNLIKQGLNNDEIAKKLNITYNTVRSHKKSINRKLKEDMNDPLSNEKFECDFKENSGSINSLSSRLKSVDEVIKFSGIDESEWEIERVKSSYHTVARKNKNSNLKWKDGKIEGEVKDSGDFKTEKLWSINLYLKKKIKNPVEEALKNVAKLLDGKQPTFEPLRKFKFKNPHMLEVSLSDSHFGKLTVNGEGLYDTEKIYTNAMDNILNKVQGFDIDKILLPLGGDFFHVDNMENSTTKGTRQDVSHHIFEIFDKGCQAVVNLVYKLRKVAPVEILWVPGNHDLSTSRYLCTFIDAWFRDDKEVSVRIGSNPRKYVKYGSTLIGLTHGNEEKHIDLPNLMMTENRKNIKNIDYFEWHIGHFHKAKEMKFVASDTIGNIPVKTLPSLSGTDYWHLSKGYLSNRILESYLYNYEFGPTGYFITNLQEIK